MPPNNNNKKYAVVKFLPLKNMEEETVAVVPSSWIDYEFDICKWPPKKYQSDKINRWVMSLTEPKHDFEDMPIQIMYEYSTYAKARKASIKAEEDSAIDTAAGETDIDKPRKRHKPAKYITSSDNSDNDFDQMKSKNQKYSEKYSIVNDSSDEEAVPTAEDIRNKVKTLLDNKQLSSSQDGYENPSSLEATSLQNKSPPYESLPWISCGKSTTSLNDTVKDTASSSKTVILQSNHKSSLPSLMKNVRTHSDPHVTAVLKTVVDRQEKMNGKIDHVILMLNRIYRKVAPEEEKIIKPRNLPTLPLNNEDSFLEIQKFLLSDDNFYPVVDYFVKLMKVNEQTDEYAAVGRLLPKVISNSLARMVNYSGSGDKLKFENTKLHEAISCAVLNAFPKSNLTKTEKKLQ
ncbi:PREDICTED: uncharacterized protein LOC108768660 [Trachymyrmex cornetzi]|nr:PREDICTED: uncharacterized protein LOC108768660 [Trachymyrmex cornetzi]